MAFLRFLVVEPLRKLALSAADVAHGTYRYTFAASQALLLVGMERLVRHQHIYEEAPHRTAQQPWHRAYVEPFALGLPRCFLPFGNLPGIQLQVFGGLLLLLEFLFLGVYVHERQAHVCLGHEQRVGRVEAQALLCEVGSQYVDGACDRVARGAECKTVVVRGGLDVQFLNEAPHQKGWAPAVNGEHKSQPLPLGKPEGAVAVHDIRYIDQLLACCRGKFRGCPSGVTCGGEVENHAAKIAIFTKTSN